MNIEEMTRVLNYMMDNNEKLAKQGLPKITIELVGGAGIGKTSIIEQIAASRGAKFVKINLAQLEEIGDLVGIPVKEYSMISPLIPIRDSEGDIVYDEDGNPKYEERNSVWVTEKVVDQFSRMGYEMCPECEPRMSYAVPAWVPKDPEEKCVLLLDDYTRGNQLFMQATMELISRGEYVSWKLPENTQIILSSNPDNGEYSVSSLDEAQKTRFVSFNMEFDTNIWARWGEQAGIRGEMINFALLFPEIFEKGRNVNARSYTMFANAAANLDFGKIEDLELASLIARGCFNDETNYVGNMFVTFVHNKLDKLITPERLLNGDWKTVQRELKDNVYQGKRDENGNTIPDKTIFRADISSTLTSRLINYIEFFAFKAGAPKSESDKVCNRIIEIVEDPEHLLTEDLIYNLVKRLNKTHGARVAKLIMHPSIRTKVL